jgi:hypothetical protein
MGGLLLPHAALSTYYAIKLEGLAHDTRNFNYYTTSSASGTKLYQGCISTYSGATSVAARAGGLEGQPDTTTSTSLSGTYAMWGMPITVEFQATQLSLYTTTTSTSTSPTTNSVSQTTSFISPTETSSSSPAASGGLSTGAKVGIAVGAVAGVLILLGIAILRWRRRGGVSRNEYSNAVATAMREVDTGFQYSNEAPSPDIPRELETRECRTQAELDGEHLLTNEMPA